VDAPAEPGEPGEPAEPVAAAAPTAPTRAVAVAGDLGVLNERWREIVERISSHPPTKPLIVVCRPISAENGVVTLGFPEDKGFLRDVAERRRPVLEEVISDVLGRQVAVRCVATNLDVLPDPSAVDEAAWLLSEAKRIFGDDAAEPKEIA
jgi:hypothetical protein